MTRQQVLDSFIAERHERQSRSQQEKIFKLTISHERKTKASKLTYVSSFLIFPKMRQKGRKKVQFREKFFFFFHFLLPWIPITKINKRMLINSSSQQLWRTTRGGLTLQPYCIDFLFLRLLVLQRSSFGFRYWTSLRAKFRSSISEPLFCCVMCIDAHLNPITRINFDFNKSNCM